MSGLCGSKWDCQKRLLCASEMDCLQDGHLSYILLRLPGKTSGWVDESQHEKWNLQRQDSLLVVCLPWTIPFGDWKWKTRWQSENGLPTVWSKQAHLSMTEIPAVLSVYAGKVGHFSPPPPPLWCDIWTAMLYELPLWAFGGQGPQSKAYCVKLTGNCGSNFYPLAKKPPTKNRCYKPC